MSESRHRRVPPRIVKVLWDKKISTENRDSRPLSYPLQFSRTETSWNTEGFLYKSFKHCETKIFPRKKLIAPTLLFINFFASGFFLEHSTERFLYKRLPYCETKKFDAANWWFPLLFINFLASGSFLEHSTDGFLYEMLRYCETKQNRRKILIPSRFIQ